MNVSIRMLKGVNYDRPKSKILITLKYYFLFHAGES